MGQYANVSSKKIYNFLKWLGNNKMVDVTVGGKHPAKVVCNKNGEVYPLPIGHREINKHIVRAFMEWLVKNEVCTKEEFDRRI
jgi:hypothetical protein